MIIFSIKNNVTGYFNPPFFCESYEEAKNKVQATLVCDTDNYLVSLRNDMSLYDIGFIDFSNGRIIGIEPVCICHLNEIYDSIPADRFKPSITREDYERLVSYVKALESDLHKASDAFANHKHYRKEIIK